MTFVYALLIVIALLIFILLLRAFNFKPKNNILPIEEEITFDKDKAISSLQELIKCKTISNKDSSLEDDKEFEKLISLLPKLYSNVTEKCELKKFEDRGLLFKWKGKNSDNPVVLMSHYDVVPVNEENWDKPPFEAIIEDGVLWGRGTLDTKSTFNGVLCAADHLISQGFVPENDIYFAFSGGEEVNGKGAVNIVDYFEENNIEPQLVLDEGGAVVENVFPGVKAPCGLIGIAEKGLMNVLYKTNSVGGHASAPKPHTPIGLLSRACCRIENKPFKRHLTKPVAEMFDTLGRHSNFVYKLIFSNLWCFAPILDIICKKSGGEINAMMRTTVAFTQAEGSSAPNVIPSTASMVANMRLNPKDNIDFALEYLKKTVDDRNIEISLIEGMEPSRISKTDCEGYEKVAKAIVSTWEGTIVSPYLMVQCSDSRHYGRISDRVYRFSAMDLTSEERASIHGINEKIRLETIVKTVEFYIRLIKQC